MYIKTLQAKSVIRFRFPFLSLYSVLAQRVQVNSTASQTMHAIAECKYRNKYIPEPKRPLFKSIVFLNFMYDLSLIVDKI